MTVAAKDSFGSGKVAGGRAGKPWKRLWQVPLLLAGVVAFGWGLKAVVKTIKPVPFEEQVVGLRHLIEGGKYGEAIEQINVMANYYHEQGQEGRLHLLAGDAHYLALAKAAPNVEGYGRVVEHYEKAVKMGVTADVEMNERWGLAALAIGRPKTAVEKLEAAIGEKPELVTTYARELVVAYLGGRQKEKALAILQKLLAEKGPTQGVPGMRAVDDRTWALCKTIEIAIAEKGSDGAALKKAVGEVEVALKRIPERDPSGRILTWVGRAKLELGDVEGARRDLREARARFLMKHLDDGRAAVMLGKIAEAKGELEEAEAVYGLAVKTHAGTPVWAAARLGRADVAVKLTYEPTTAKVVVGLDAHGPSTKIEVQEGHAETTVAAGHGEEKHGEAGHGEKVAKHEDGHGATTAPGLAGLPAGVVADYRYAIETVRDETVPLEGRAELIDVGQVRASFTAGYERASTKGNLEQALAYLTLAKELEGKDDEAMAFRLGLTQERKGLELAEAKDEAGARVMFTEAAEAYRRHAKLSTMDDPVSGNSLWKSAQLYDKAGRVAESIEVYEQFTVQRPRDARVSEGLLAMGRLYQSSGQVEKAVEYYGRAMKEFARTPAAYIATVELARCHMAMLDAMPRKMEGEEEVMTPERQAVFEQAEGGLLSLVQNNGDLLPQANEFRVSLFTLGELYYRNGKWAEAILRLEEAVERYPDDAGLARAMYMLAQCYRRSAGDIARAIKKDPAIAGRDALELARMERLAKGGGLLTRVIGMLDGAPDGHGTEKAVVRTALEEACLRGSYMDRAACYFDRGEYPTAIKLYDETAMRFAEEPVAVQAYVQIVNAYLAMKQPTQASAAAERGRWILKRVPGEAFVAPSPGREYYEKLLALGKV